MRTLIVSFLGLILCFANVLQAFEGPENPLVEQVIAEDQEVFLLIDGRWLKTEGFQVSSAGAFVFINGAWTLLSQAVEFGDFEASWQCSKCRRYSMDGINTCPYCGKRKNA